MFLATTKFVKRFSQRSHLAAAESTGSVPNAGSPSDLSSMSMLIYAGLVAGSVLSSCHDSIGTPLSFWGGVGGCCLSTLTP